MMCSPSFLIFFLITVLAICGIGASLSKESGAETMLIMSNILFILYGMYMAIIENKRSR